MLVGASLGIAPYALHLHLCQLQSAPLQVTWRRQRLGAASRGTCGGGAFAASSAMWKCGRPSSACAAWCCPCRWAGFVQGFQVCDISGCYSSLELHQPKEACAESLHWLHMLRCLRHCPQRYPMQGPLATHLTAHVVTCRRTPTPTSNLPHSAASRIAAGEVSWMVHDSPCVFPPPDAHSNV